MKAGKYSQLTLPVTGFDTDILTALLFEYGCSGIEEYSEEAWIVYFNEELSSSQIVEITTRLTGLNPELDPLEIQFSTREVEDWNAEWKAHFKPIAVTGRVIVCPPWDVPEKMPEDGTLIKIDPQMAFGTGSHETTQLMITALEEYFQPGVRVLDAGTGSGILAILAKKWGAASVFAFDVEQEAIENCQHNARLNDVEGIEFREGDESVIPDEKFPLILANINRNVLINILPVLFGHLSPGGLLIFSGLLDADEGVFVNALPAGTEILKRYQKNEWIALVVKGQ
ncbi:MAG: 50S ribosomal protein L11 methyltransferase [Calditrichia bacterium]